MHSKISFQGIEGESIVSQISKEEYLAKLELYEKLVATNPDIKRKGKTMPYTSLNGHMFSFLAKEGKMSLRLPAGDRQEFIEKYESELSEQYGAVMKEYVVVPDDLLENTDVLKEYFEVSYTYVGTLKPKPTKKKK